MRWMDEQTSSEETRVDLRIFLDETIDDHDGRVTVVVHAEQQFVLSHTNTRTHTLYPVNNHRPDHSPLSEVCTPLMLFIMSSSRTLMHANFHTLRHRPSITTTCALDGSWTITIFSGYEYFTIFTLYF